MAKLVSETYGEALFSLGLEKGIVDSLMEEIDALRGILEENPGFSRLMNHPDIGRDEKLEVLQKVFEGKLSDTMYGFLEVLIHKGRYGAAEDIFTYYTDRYKAYHRIGVAFVTSAVELTGAQKSKIEKRLLETTQFDKMELHFSLDEELIGGLVIRIGDRVVDSSIRTKLEGLQRQLMKVQLL